jgi:hypothetical protein
MKDFVRQELHTKTVTMPWIDWSTIREAFKRNMPAMTFNQTACFKRLLRELDDQKGAHYV